MQAEQRQEESEWIKCELWQTERNCQYVKLNHIQLWVLTEWCLGPGLWCQLYSNTVSQECHWNKLAFSDDPTEALNPLLLGNLVEGSYKNKTLQTNIIFNTSPLCAQKYSFACLSCSKLFCSKNSCVIKELRANATSSSVLHALVKMFLKLNDVGNLRPVSRSRLSGNFEYVEPSSWNRPLKLFWSRK